MIRRRLYYLSLDIVEKLTGVRVDVHWKVAHALTGRDSIRIAKKFLRVFVDQASLHPDARVLDVGCGMGRMAIPLTEYLSPKGSYDGFDVIPEVIKSCQENIGAEHPNFRFTLVNARNRFYNIGDAMPASKVKFPYESESFDFVFLRSVFTHLLPREMRNYFDEIARVLRPGGKCLITFFLANSESLELMQSRKGIFNFKHERDGYRVIDPTLEERNVAYDEKLVQALYEGHGLEILEPIRYGSWCGRPDRWNFQDIIIGVKT